MENQTNLKSEIIADESKFQRVWSEASWKTWYEVYRE